MWGLCWAILGNIGVVLGPRWAVSALSGRLLGLFFAISELSSILIGRSGRIWGHLGPLLGLLGPNLGLLMDLRACKNLSFCTVFEHSCFSTAYALSRPFCFHFRRLRTSLGPSWADFGAIWEGPFMALDALFLSTCISEVVPKLHLTNLEPHLRAHPPHLQLSSAHLCWSPPVLAIFTRSQAILGLSWAFWSLPMSLRPHKNCVFC